MCCAWCKPGMLQACLPCHTCPAAAPAGAAGRRPRRHRRPCPHGRVGRHHGCQQPLLRGEPPDPEAPPGQGRMWQARARAAPPAPLPDCPSTPQAPNKPSCRRNCPPVAPRALHPPPVQVDIVYNAQGRPLERVEWVTAHVGHSGWLDAQDVPLTRDPQAPHMFRGLFRRARGSSGCHPGRAV